MQHGYGSILPLISLTRNKKENASFTYNFTFVCFLIDQLPHDPETILSLPSWAMSYDIIQKNKTILYYINLIYFARVLGNINNRYGSDRMSLNSLSK